MTPGSPIGRLLGGSQHSSRGHIPCRPLPAYGKNLCSFRQSQGLQPSASQRDSLASSGRPRHEHRRHPPLISEFSHVRVLCTGEVPISRCKILSAHIQGVDQSDSPAQGLHALPPQDLVQVLNVSGQALRVPHTIPGSQASSCNHQVRSGAARDQVQQGPQRMAGWGHSVEDLPKASGQGLRSGAAIASQVQRGFQVPEVSCKGM